MRAEKPVEEKSYIRERERAAALKVERSLRRKQGLFDPLDVSDLPTQSSRDFDPRKW